MQVPDHQILCSGAIEPQSNCIEHPELVAQRIERYAQALSRAVTLFADEVMPAFT